MKLLTVPAITNAQGDKVPDLPAGVDYVGHCPPGGTTYLVAVPDAAVVSAKTGRTTLSTRKAQTDELARRELSEAAVNSWRIG